VPAFDPVYKEGDELYDIYLGKTRDKKYLLLGIASKDTTEFRYLPAAETRKEFAVFLLGKKDIAISSITAKTCSTYAPIGILPGMC
jgi:protease II